MNRVGLAYVMGKEKYKENAELKLIAVKNRLTGRQLPKPVFRSVEYIYIHTYIHKMFTVAQLCYSRVAADASFEPLLLRIRLDASNTGKKGETHTGEECNLLLPEGPPPPILFLHVVPLLAPVIYTHMFVCSATRQYS